MSILRLYTCSIVSDLPEQCTHSMGKRLLSRIAVMGDIGRGLYVSPDVVPVYRRILQLADIITPNQFEVEYVQRRALRLADSTQPGLVSLCMRPDIGGLRRRKLGDNFIGFAADNL